MTPPPSPSPQLPSPVQRNLRVHGPDIPDIPEAPCTPPCTPRTPRHTPRQTKQVLWVELSPEKDPTEWKDKMEDWAQDWCIPHPYPSCPPCPLCPLREHGASMDDMFDVDQLLDLMELPGSQGLDISSCFPNKPPLLAPWLERCPPPPLGPLPALSTESHSP
ncbi:unnamed protein product [Symbiodinium natans]|uniref:Uncharacterized protein n=1 Tax=Symbiodinium natans TaxID=878477 RepID=A0A812K6D0_9DINO|nr:unnamed protein product [Symbiodinium natans]